MGNKLTKDALRQAGISNSFDVALRVWDRKARRVFLRYRRPDIRLGISPAWMVHGVHFSTAPKSHYQDNGSKAFHPWDGKDKAEVLQAAKDWAGKEYGITGWERDVFGGWHPAGTLDALREAIGGVKEAS